MSYRLSILKQAQVMLTNNPTLLRACVSKWADTHMCFKKKKKVKLLDYRRKKQTSSWVYHELIADTDKWQWQTILLLRCHRELVLKSALFLAAVRLPDHYTASQKTPKMLQGDGWLLSLEFCLCRLLVEQVSKESETLAVYLWLAYLNVCSWKIGG